MRIHTCIDSLIAYAIEKELAMPEDRTVLRNRFMALFRLDDWVAVEEPLSQDLEQILQSALEYACSAGLCNDSPTERDLFDTRLMGVITPMPREVISTFRCLYQDSPRSATDWYYTFSCNTDYIRQYRITKDMRWKYKSPYGDMDITINLSKPEKDPIAIAAAKNAPQSGYPKCQLCVENEGYAGRLNHPARQNHRVIPIRICEEDWCLQYSPYVYYNEHCIVFNRQHIPMKIDRSAFAKLLDFVGQFPHYFVGSNADLPIVGGSILSHEHFQGGHYTFAMERAPVEIPLSFSGFADVQAGIVKWPMSVIRLDCADPARLAELADKILRCWRSYDDAESGIYACTDGQPHNTITPIARRNGALYELDLVLRNNRTTPEHPLGLFHPHADKHHIKKENIGLIEVMGLAVLPRRLKDELFALKDTIVQGVVPSGELSKHADWAAQLCGQYTFTEENAMEILLQETGKVFTQVLEDAGVFKCTISGRAAFLRFAAAVNHYSIEEATL